MFALNLAMLLLTIIQTCLDWIDLLIKRESRLQLLSITMRSLQTNLACTAYASFILENRRASKWSFWFYVFPGSFISFTTTLVIFIIACFEDDLECEHPLWLVMTVFQLLVSIVFAFIGLAAAREASVHYVGDRHQFYVPNEVATKRRALWLLMATFLVAAVAQVIGDAWRMDLARSGESCRYHASHGEEFLRVILYILSFDLPAWGVLLVFFYLPRHSFDAGNDVELPNISLLQWQDIEMNTSEEGREDDVDGIGDDDDDGVVRNGVKEIEDILSAEAALPLRMT